MPLCTPCVCGGFCLQGQRALLHRDPQLDASSLGTAKSAQTQAEVKAGRMYFMTSSSAAAPLAKGDILGSHCRASRALRTAPRPCHAAPNCSLPAASCLRDGCHPSPTERARVSPKHLLKALLPSTKLAARASVRPLP